MGTISVNASGTLEWHGRSYRCAVGRGGVAANKEEGDGVTPAGTFALREVRYRPDRIEALSTALPSSPLSPNDGWCDDPADAEYNRRVTVPYAKSAESLWRDDHLYDLIVVIGYNDDPPVSGKGSAIFMHVAREGYSPTAGCIALSKDDLLAIVRSVAKDTTIEIVP